MVRMEIPGSIKSPHFEEFLNEFYSFVKQIAFVYRNKQGKQEENFKQDVNYKLRGYFEKIGFHASIDNAFSLPKTGSVDSLLDKVIIEYKSPGLLTTSNPSRANTDGITKSKKYIVSLAKDENRKLGRYRAIVFDGFYFVFCRFVGNEFIADEPIGFTKSSTRIFLSTILSIKSDRPFTAEKLSELFGPTSQIAKDILEALYTALSDGSKQKTQTLFEQWKVNFSQASEFIENEKKALALRNAYRLSSTVKDAAKLLYCVHTYLALLMKVIAIDVVSQFSDLPIFSKYALGKSGAAFRTMLRNLEHGDQFKIAGINNFLEVDYFSWYVDELHTELEEEIRNLLLEFEKFDLTTLVAEPFFTSDLIKNLYEKLIPKKIRHDLGEYYTPDWLAEFVLDEAGYAGDVGKRVLDPACGSGTFLVIAIKRLKNKCYRNSMSDRNTLKEIVENVVGFDLNPLAVIAARTNYLIALSELLGSVRESNEQITIPIYLCDTLLSPKNRGGKLLPEIELDTSVGRLVFPTSIAHNDVFFTFIEVLKNGIEANLSNQDFEAFLVREGISAEESIVRLYSRLLQLDHEGRNGIWANIIKNSFAPLLEEKFDYVLGNPPWINWEHLPASYRTLNSELWKYYGLFTLKGMETILGGGKKDISALFTYVSVDRFLKDQGVLGFVITQTLFKNRGSAEGFRKFCLEGEETAKPRPFSVTSVHDFVQVKPFEAANRTAVLFIKKSGKTRYPVPYTIWTRGRGTRFDNETPLKFIKNNTTKLSCSAQPVDKSQSNSSWITLPAELNTFAQRFIGKSNYRAVAGAYGALNAFFWLKILGKRQSLVKVKNYRERSKIKVPPFEKWIEPTYIYPLLCGRDIAAFSAEPKIYTFLLQDPKTKKGITESVLKRNAVRTYNLLRTPNHKRLLKARAVFKRYYDEDKDPYWSMFNVGLEIMKPYKVVWREQARQMTAAVIGAKQDNWLGRKVVIPDHKLMLIGLDSKEEAHYICGFLNSFIAILIVAGYAVDTSIDTHVLENIKIPKFDKSDKLHKFLRDRSQAYHSGREKYVQEHFDAKLAKILKVDEKALKSITDFLRRRFGTKSRT